MSYKTNLELAYHMGYGDALARKMPDMDQLTVMNEDTCHDNNAELRELILDVADVLEELTKLRELSERLRSAVSDGSDNVRDAFAENVKLRKLLLDVWNDAIRFDGFWDYVMDDGEIYNEDELPHYQERMRELGIDVN